MTTIALTLADADHVVAARVGDELLIELDANPTTGFEWKVDSINGPMALLGEEFVAGGGAIGDGGVHRFRFALAARGEAACRLKHWRSWVGDSSVRLQHEFKVLIEN